jgi:hypothetical protein
MTSSKKAYMSISTEYVAIHQEGEEGRRRKAGRKEGRRRKNASI